jgi:predicted nucleic acid-binding protein
VNAKSWSVSQLTAKHELVALDANVVIYLLENVEPGASRAAAIVDAIESGEVRGSMSTVAQTEILVGPARSADPMIFELAAQELRELRVAKNPLTARIAEDAAWVRGQTGLRLPDAVHLATARASGATALVTNDRRIRSRPGLDVYYLDDLELRQPDEPHEPTAPDEPVR